MSGFFTELRYAFEKKLVLSKQESWDIILAGVILSVIFGINDDRSTMVIDSYWYVHFFVGALAVYFALLINVLSSKVFAYLKGFEARVRVNYYGVIGGLILSLLLHGFPVFAWGGTELVVDDKKRIGVFRKFMTTSEMAFSSILGLVSNLVVGTIFVLWGELIDNPLITFVGLINFFVAVYSLVPIPEFTNAFPILLHSRMWYVFILTFSISYVLLVVYTPLYLALITGITMSIIMTYWYFKKYE